MHVGRSSIFEIWSIEHHVLDQQHKYFQPIEYYTEKKQKEEEEAQQSIAAAGGPSEYAF